jgi:hypothetical protein
MTSSFLPVALALCLLGGCSLIYDFDALPSPDETVSPSDAAGQADGGASDAQPPDAFEP